MDIGPEVENLARVGGLSKRFRAPELAACIARASVSPTPTNLEGIARPGRGPCSSRSHHGPAYAGSTA